MKTEQKYMAVNEARRKKFKLIPLNDLVHLIDTRKGGKESLLSHYNEHTEKDELYYKLKGMVEAYEDIESWLRCIPKMTPEKIIKEFENDGN